MRAWEFLQSNVEPKNVDVHFPEDSSDEEIVTIIGALRGVADGLGCFKATTDVTDVDAIKENGETFSFDDANKADAFMGRVIVHLTNVEITMKTATDLDITANT